MTWIPTAERMPPPGEEVLAIVVSNDRGYRVVVVADYHDAANRPEMDPEAEYIEGYEYDERRDVWLCPAGWYEAARLTDDESRMWRIDCPVTHWMPLPAKPEKEQP